VEGLILPAPASSWSVPNWTEWLQYSTIKVPISLDQVHPADIHSYYIPLIRQVGRCWSQSAGLKITVDMESMLCGLDDGMGNLALCGMLLGNMCRCVWIPAS